MSEYAIEDIFKYSNHDRDEFLSTVNSEYTQWNDGERRYMLVWYLYNNNYLSTNLIYSPIFKDAVINSKSYTEFLDYFNNFVRENIYQTLLDIAYYEGAFGDSIREKSFNRAAAVFNNYDGSIDDLIRNKVKLEGIGPSSIVVIKDIKENNYSQRLMELEIKAIPRSEEFETIKLFTTVHGISIITARSLYNLGYRTIESLQGAQLSKAQKLGLKYYHDLNQPIPKLEMEYWQNEISELFGDLINWDIAGSYRRGEDFSGDIDIIVQDVNIDDSLKLLKPIIKVTLEKGQKKFIGLVQKGQTLYRQIDIRSFTKEEWPFGELYNISGKNFNILIRKKASSLGYRLNEFSMVDKATGQKVKVETERDIFKILGLKYLKPEQRLRTITELPTE